MATTRTVLSDSGHSQEAERRSAILFISGLDDSTPDQTADGVASRMVYALEREATTGQATYAVLPGSNEVEIAKGLKLSRATVKRSAPDGSSAAVDVWRLPTATQLTQGYAEAGLLQRVLRGARVVARYSRLATMAFRRGGPAKRAVDRAQVWVVRALIVLLGVYLVGLVVSLLGEVASMDWVPDWLSGAVLAVTGLGIWQSKLVKRVSDAAVQMHCLLEYLGDGESVGAFRGQIADALNHFEEQKDVAYDRVDVVAYSFGTVVALDALLPRASEPGPRFDTVDTVVTIGCPFDLIQTYWPSYYKKRHRRGGVPERWINVYSPRDVFGSNFEDNDGNPIGIGVGDGDEAEAVTPESKEWVVVAEDAEDVQVWQILRLPGLEAHTLYWDPRAERDESIYSLVVKELYAGTTVLA